MKPTTYLGLRVPSEIVREIDNAVGENLVSRSDWVRRAILDRLCHERQKRLERRGSPI
jgi:metal-responsive CopG/Arc/MetJ family transcriptional regulator